MDHKDQPPNMIDPSLLVLPLPPPLPPLSVTLRALQLPEILATVARWTEPVEAIQCIRVCRAWHAHFLPVVWRSLALYRHDILEAPHDGIVAAHGPLVQDLALYIYPREAPEVLARLHCFASHMARLHELKFRIVGGTDSYFPIAHQWLVANRRTLRRFCWSTTRDARKPTRILEAAQYFPGGGGLAATGDLGGCENTGETGDDHDGRRRDQGGQGKGMERLQALTLEGWDLTMAHLRHLLQACPRLESLSLHRNHFLDRDHQDDHHSAPELAGLTATTAPSGSTMDWSHPPTLETQPVTTVPYQHQHPRVCELQTEGEMPPMLLFASIPNLERWTARELVDLDVRRLAQQIQGSNMCATLTYLDLQRAFSPEMMDQDDGDDEQDTDAEETPLAVSSDSIGSHSPHAHSTTLEAIPINNSTGSGVGVGGATGDNSDMANTLDLVPVIRAIHKDTLQTLRLSRCMLSRAGIRVLCEHHGQSLEHISLEYARKRQRRRPRQQQQQQQQHQQDQAGAVAISPLASSLSPTPSPINAPGHGNGHTDSSESPQDKTISRDDADTYLNIILESCPNLKSFRVRQPHRTYGSVRLRTTTASSSGSSLSSSASCLAKTHGRDRLGPSPAWVCQDLRELEVQLDEWVSDHAAIDRLLTVGLGATLAGSDQGSSSIKARGCEAETAGSTNDLFMLTKARLSSLQHLESINLGTGWYTLRRVSHCGASCFS